MIQRLPLVINGGQIEQLQSGDTLSGAGFPQTDPRVAGALWNNNGVLSVSLTVASVSDYTFATPGSAQGPFPLTAPWRAVTTLVGTPSIYRTDWQGQQLLYATPRTQLCPYSTTPAVSPWASQNSVITANASIAPDGTTTAINISDGTDGINSSHAQNSPNTTTAAGYVCVSGYFKHTNAQWCGLQRGSDFYSGAFDLVNGVTAGFYGSPIVSTGIAAAAQGYYRCWVVFQNSAALTTTYNACIGYAYDALGGTGNGSTVDFWGMQTEQVATATSLPTAYIANATSAALTLTDYTLNGVNVML